MRRLTIATNNLHKLGEIRAILGSDYQLTTLQEIGCSEELAEDQDTIEGNSRQKAEYVFQKYHVNCFADDSGLEVDALNGEPGVYSAMYAGAHRNAQDNINLLLSKLKGVTNRKARFKTVITLASASGIRQFEGTVEGSIIDHKRGTEGFGYDPVFLPHGFDKTLAEMTFEEKNKISHRARAVAKLVAFLKTNS